jgi:riboflavin-specific deaminase-like protein
MHAKPSPDIFELTFEKIAETRHRRHRPFVSICYAQSLDGCIASRNNDPIALSGRESMVLTHRLRTCFDGILVGIGTVLADNPRLNARLFDGPDPQPIVLDTRLRTPTEAALLTRNKKKCWITCGENGSADRKTALENAGADILKCKTDAERRIDLPQLMQQLLEKGIGSIMVEGGARVITSFINSRLVDQLIVTIAPKLLGGLPVVDQRGIVVKPFLPLNQIRYQRLGDDMILWATPQWSGP